MDTLIKEPWRCDRTGNPVGTDTEMVGAGLCQCQGCRAHRALEAANREIERWHYAAMKAGVVVCTDGSLIYATSERLEKAEARLSTIAHGREAEPTEEGIALILINSLREHHGLDPLSIETLRRIGSWPPKAAALAQARAVHRAIAAAPASPPKLEISAEERAMLDDAKGRLARRSPPPRELPEEEEIKEIIMHHVWLKGGWQKCDFLGGVNEAARAILSRIKE